MAIGFMKKISPEYVLKNAIEDMKQTGLEGLKPYLTKDALERIRKIQMVSGGIELFSEITMTGTASQDSVGGISAVLLLLERLSECDWTIIDVLKGSSSAKGILGFTYEDTMEGTVELSMITEEKEWRIDSIKMPKFTKLSMTF